MSMMLRKLGCEVTVADNGVMAINAFKRTSQERAESKIAATFDVVLMDGNMPTLGSYRYLSLRSQNGISAHAYV